MRATLNQTTLNFDDRGKGAAVIFLHAYPLNLEMWTPQVEALSQDYRMIRLDWRGFGGSAPPDSTLTMELAADDVRVLMEHLGVRRSVLVGLSMGGYAVFAFYRKYRDFVRALVLADTRSTADTDEGRKARAAVIATAREKGVEAIADQMVPKLLCEKTLKEEPALVRRVREMVVASSVEGIVRTLEGLAARPDATPLLAEISCPALILVGADDTLTPPADAHAMAERIRGAELQILPDAGHLSNLEQPENFNRALRDFLRKNQ